MTFPRFAGAGLVTTHRYEVSIAKNYLSDFELGQNFWAVVLKGRLSDAVSRLNLKLPPDAVAEVRRRGAEPGQVVQVALTPEHPSLVQNNRAFHRLLLNGVRVEYTPEPTLSPALFQGERVIDHAMLIDFHHPERNDFLVANQFTVTGTKKRRRPNLVVRVDSARIRRRDDTAASKRFGRNEFRGPFWRLTCPSARAGFWPCRTASRRRRCRIRRGSFSWPLRCPRLRRRWRRRGPCGGREGRWLRR